MDSFMESLMNGSINTWFYCLCEEAMNNVSNKNILIHTCNTLWCPIVLFLLYDVLSWYTSPQEIVLFSLALLIRPDHHWPYSFLNWISSYVIIYYTVNGRTLPTLNRSHHSHHHSLCGNENWLLLLHGYKTILPWLFLPALHNLF